MLQKDMQYSAVTSGIMLVPFSLLSALIAKYVLPQFSKKMNASKIGLIRWISMSLGALCLLFSILFGHSLPILLIGSAFISGIGITFCFTGLSVLGIQDIAPENYGIASSIGTTCYFIGAGIGLSFIALFSQLYVSTFAVGHLSLFILLGYTILAIGFILFFIKSNKRG